MLIETAAFSQYTLIFSRRIFLIIFNETVSFNHVRYTPTGLPVLRTKKRFKFFTYQNGPLRVQRGGACCWTDISVSNVPSNTQGTPGNYLLQVTLFRQCFCPIKPDKWNSAQSWFGQNDVQVQAYFRNLTNQHVQAALGRPVETKLICKSILTPKSSRPGARCHLMCPATGAVGRSISVSE